MEDNHAESKGDVTRLNGTYSLQNYSYDTNGRLASNAGVTYSYNNPAHVHAVTGTSDGRSYGYDANGNQTTRTVGGQTYTLSYDAESRMVGVSGPVSATFVYDGDGNRVTSTIGTTNTVYINGYFEWSGSLSTMRRYYYAGDQRIAMRLGTTTLRFLLGDHLGSTAITATTTGSKLAELRYYPWGGVRYSYGTTPTDYRFTGQQELSSIGLYNYGARYYDPQLGRFVAPDSIIPQQQGTQAWDRYAYVNNSPLNGVDPNGHDLVACTKPGVMHCGGGGTTSSGLLDGQVVTAASTTTIDIPESSTTYIDTSQLTEETFIIPFPLFAAGRGLPPLTPTPPTLRILGFNYEGSTYDMIFRGGRVVAGLLDDLGYPLGGSSYSTPTQLVKSGLSRGTIYTIAQGTDIGNFSVFETSEQGYFRIGIIDDQDAISLVREYESLWRFTGTSFRNNTIFGGGGGAGPLDMFLTK